MWWIRAYIGKYLKEARSTVRPQSGTVAQPDLSLDSAIDEEGDATHLERIEDDGPGPEDTYLSAEGDREVRDALGKVRKRIGELGWDIVHNRLEQDQPRTLEEIGKRWGVSRERVRQVELKTKQFLHRYLEPVGATTWRAPPSRLSIRRTRRACQAAGPSSFLDRGSAAGPRRDGPCACGPAGDLQWRMRAGDACAARGMSSALPPRMAMLVSAGEQPWRAGSRRIPAVVYDAREVARETRAEGQRQAADLLAHARAQAEALRAAAVSAGREEGLAQATRSPRGRRSCRPAPRPGRARAGRARARRWRGESCPGSSSGTAGPWWSSRRGRSRRRDSAARSRSAAHPDDLGALRTAEPQLLGSLLRARRLAFVEDASVERGGVVVETEAGSYDAAWRRSSRRSAARCAGDEEAPW